MIHIQRMRAVHPHFITDQKGRKISVVLPIKDFDAIMEDLEELDDIQFFDAAKAANLPSIPIDEAFDLIEKQRAKK